MTPTKLSLRHLHAEGWTVDVAERWMSAGKRGLVRKDLFGMIDLVALRGSQTMGVQTTSHTNALTRHKKIADAEHAERLRALLDAGWLIVVHGWRLSTRDGHACKHRPDPCGCRWTLHRLIHVTEAQP